MSVVIRFTFLLKFNNSFNKSQLKATNVLDALRIHKSTPRLDLGIISIPIESNKPANPTLHSELRGNLQINPTNIATTETIEETKPPPRKSYAHQSNTTKQLPCNLEMRREIA